MYQETKTYKPDSRYNNVIIGRFLGQLSKDGKKNTATRVMYKTLDIIREKTKKEPLEILDEAIKNVSPVLEVKGKRVGGANYQIPIPVMGNRRTTLAIRWILESTRKKKGKPMAERLALEFIDAAEKKGAAIKKREDIQRMAEANRAFAHFA